jgi:putative tryptophan/tyrosine transport system substrate-binding protein
MAGMRRRDFTIGLVLGAAAESAQTQDRAKQHRIAIIRPTGPVSIMSDTGHPFWRAFFEELRQLGDIEGQNLTVERYSGEGRPEGFPDLAREVASSNLDVTVALGDAIAHAVRAANGTMPIVWMGGDAIGASLAASLARPGGNITGVSVNAGVEIWGKRLQLLKEAVPSASTVACLAIRTEWEGLEGPLREAGRRLQISMIDMPLEEATPAEFQRVFAAITLDRPDAIIIGSDGILLPYRQLIVELVEKNRRPAIYAWRDYVEAGGLMAYASDLPELGRRIADDVHEILNGAKPSDIPIYQPSKFEFLINLKAAGTLGITIPPTLLALADEVIE